MVVEHFDRWSTQKSQWTGSGTRRLSVALTVLQNGLEIFLEAKHEYSQPLYDSLCNTSSYFTVMVRPPAVVHGYHVCARVGVCVCVHGQTRLQESDIWSPACCADPHVKGNNATGGHRFSSVACSPTQVCVCVCVLIQCSLQAGTPAQLSD